MTSKTITLTGSEKDTFPDFPPRDDMQNWLYLYDTAIVSSLAIYFRDLPYTVVASEVPVGPNLPNRDDARIPDLLVAFECDLELLKGAAQLFHREPGQSSSLCFGGCVPIHRAAGLYDQAAGL